MTNEQIKIKDLLSPKAELLQTDIDILYNAMILVSEGKYNPELITDVLDIVLLDKNKLSMLTITCGVYAVTDYNINSIIIKSKHCKVLCIDTLENCKICHKAFLTAKMIRNYKNS